MRWLISENKNNYESIQYPALVSNSLRINKKVYSKEEHIKHALQFSRWSLETKLNVSKLNITDIINDSDEVWDYISLYYDVEQFGISFIYGSMENIPNRVYWAIKRIKQELNQLEYIRMKSEENNQNQSSNKGK